MVSAQSSQIGFYTTVGDWDYCECVTSTGKIRNPTWCVKLYKFNNYLVKRTDKICVKDRTCTISPPARNVLYKSNLLVIQVQLWSIELSWVFDPLREVTPFEFYLDCERTSDTRPINLWVLFLVLNYLPFVRFMGNSATLEASVSHTTNYNWPIPFQQVWLIGNGFLNLDSPPLKIHRKFQFEPTTKSF